MTSQGEAYTERLRADLLKLKEAVDSAAESPSLSPATFDRIYALLHNIRVQGEAAGSALVTSISALACGILKRARSPDPGTCRVVKAHVDALAIIIEHGVTGDGGALGERMVEELRGLARAVGG